MVYLPTCSMKNYVGTYMDAMGFVKCWGNVPTCGLRKKNGPGWGGCGKMGPESTLISSLFFFGGQFLVTKLQISQKMACHLEKIFLKQSKQKHSLRVFPSSCHPTKSTLVCPHRGEHGKNSQLHILQSLRSHK